MNSFGGPLSQHSKRCFDDGVHQRSEAGERHTKVGQRERRVCAKAFNLQKRGYRRREKWIQGRERALPFVRLLRMSLGAQNDHLSKVKRPGRSHLYGCSGLSYGRERMALQSRC